ncbi:hypothetical protein [uncultured Aquimarina sp.]|uniref:hypothetical protein n=1 Tax=uncultured Aquimarina sp. TaxID=575652 RepID=UPI00262EE16C|nr:hypothetical protein [uncultured Aquimarina sp.]
MEKFESLKIEQIGLRSIYGGTTTESTMANSDGTTSCDVYEDTNGNGHPDAGECLEFVDCK